MHGGVDYGHAVCGGREARWCRVEEGIYDGTMGGIL